MLIDHILYHLLTYVKQLTKQYLWNQEKIGISQLMKQYPFPDKCLEDKVELIENLTKIFVRIDTLDMKIPKRWRENMIISILEEFIDYDELYFPLKLNFRGKNIWIFPL